jgi:cytochrome c peroxidase
MTTRKSSFLVAVCAVVTSAAAFPAVAAQPVSLDQVPIPEPANLGRFVKDKPAAIRLGKALFWDMQVGSDGLTACASCHFHAGTDDRTRNTLNPGARGTFAAGTRANADVQRADFPFHALADRDDSLSSVTRDRDHVTGAQGVPKTRLQGVLAGRATELGHPVRDGVFGQSARNVRQVTGRNSPSVINAVFNHSNFWDGRASHYFNGVNPFGILDQEARILVNEGTGLTPVKITARTPAEMAANPFVLDKASLASQAVGPPGSDVEMSWAGRSFPEIGRKLLSLKPLARQRVHRADSVLGAWVDTTGQGLRTTYAEMIRAAFRNELWDGGQAPNGFGHMEANFALLFGLSVQLYEATLVSDDTPFDRFVRGDPLALSPRQRDGMNLFFSGGTACTACHVGPEFTAASITQTLSPAEAGLIELMPGATGDLVNYDIGFYNIGVRPTAEDHGRGGRVTLNGLSMPLSFVGQYFFGQDTGLTLPFTPIAQPGCINTLLSDPPRVCPTLTDPPDRKAVDGAFKVPGLRNVELTGPYMHNGGMATLMQVVDFYVRGGDFHLANLENLDPFVDGIPGMQRDELRKAQLVDFLVALTDERVRWERAPFDHPQLFVADGHENRLEGNPKRSRVLADRLREIPAVGALGRATEQLAPVKPFLADGLDGDALANFHFQH